MVLPIALVLVLGARPVAAPLRGSLEQRVVTEDAVGVLVRFLGVTKSEAQDGLDAVVKAQAGSGELQIGFVKTQASSLAVLYFVGQKQVTLARLRTLAAACSQIKGAKSAYLFLHPGPRNPELETEAVWTFEAGKPVVEKRIAFRDDDSYMQWVRRKISRSELDEKMWPTWPLSELSLALGLPGRDFLERPFGMLDLATYGFPRDVGENLVLVQVYLPDPTLLEIRQLAEKQSASPSKVVQDALMSVDKEQKLGAQVPTSGRAPWDEAMPQSEKLTPRAFELFLTRDLFNKLDARASDETVSLSKLVEYAWRQAHPFAKSPP